MTKRELYRLEQIAQPEQKSGISFELISILFLRHRNLDQGFQDKGCAYELDSWRDKQNGPACVRDVYTLRTIKGKVPVGRFKHGRYGHP